MIGDPLSAEAILMTAISCMRSIFIALTALTFVAAAHALAPQDSALPDSLKIARPAGISDETWQRIVDGYAGQKAEFAQLLIELDDNRIDYPMDSMETVLEKQHAISQFMNAFLHSTVRDMAEIDLMLNYVMMRNATSPRLTGRVINVGPMDEFTTLEKALEAAVSGDCIRLEKGTYQFVDSRTLFSRGDAPSDIAIVGESREDTIVQFANRQSLPTAIRWRFADLTINCGNSEVLDLRRGGTAEFNNCLIREYNSGSGGSNAISGNTTVIVVENSVFEGESGRSVGRSKGTAFDLRGRNLLYCRETKFEKNSEILRVNFHCVFDKCSAIDGTNSLRVYPSGKVLVRENEIIDERKDFEQFEARADEIEFINLALGKTVKLDERSETIVQRLKLQRHPQYWIGLMRSNDSSIRTIAMKQLESMLPVDAEIDDENETLEYAADIECGRLLNWLELNKSDLQWDEPSATYKRIESDEGDD